MIAADARTNPIRWRSCLHSFPDEATPRRCLLCGAVDHGAVPMPQSAPSGGMAGYRIGYAMFTYSDEPEAKVRRLTCERGHPTQFQHYVYRDTERVRVVCWTCTNERRAAREQEACPNGHSGNRWYDPKHRRVMCRDCDAMRARQRRAAKIANRYAEAASA